MRRASPLIVSLFVGSAAIGLWSSCGSGSKSDENDKPELVAESGPETVSGEVTDVTTPLTLAIKSGPLAGSSVEIAAGALPAGAKVTLGPDEAPAKFAATAGVIVASSAMSMSAVDKDGVVIVAPTGTITLSIGMTDAAASLAVGAAADLCVFQSIPPSLYVIFRDAAITSAGKITTVNPKNFGVFQVTYCADLEVAGFLTPDEVEEKPLEGDAGAFFAKIVGVHSFKAVDTQLNSTETWTPGKIYDIIVTAAGKVILHTDGKRIEMHYGEQESDSYIHDGHEEYASMTRDGAKVKVQLQFAESKLFFTWEIGQYPNRIFWRFDDIGPTGSEGPLGALQATYAAATHTHRITYVNNLYQLPDDYPETTPVSVTIDVNGDVSASTFGAFDFNDKTHTQQSTSNGVSSFAIKYYRPDPTTYPREELQMNFTAGVWTGGNLKKLNSASNDITYNFVK